MLSEGFVGWLRSLYTDLLIVADGNDRSAFKIVSGNNVKLDATTI